MNARAWRWLVDAIAVYRLTRLVTADGLSEPLREAVAEWADSGSQSAVKAKVAELVDCRWCTSMWLALGVVYIARRCSWWPDIADALAFSAVGTLLARLEAE